MKKHRKFNTQAVMAPENPKSPITYVLEQQKLRTRQDLLKLRLAIDSAENIVNYDRELLHDIYRQIVIDPYLESNWNSRKMKTKTRAFQLVNQNGEEDDRTKLFEQNWFIDFMDAALDSFLWGFTMIEFGPWMGDKFSPYMVKNKMYDAINVIDRDNVKPELGIITEIPGNNTGIYFDDPVYGKNLMYIGSHSKSLECILFKVAKYILFKDNCLGNWSEWAEVFGMDKRVGYTRTRDDERKAFLKAMRDLGANAYGVFNEGDKVEYIGSQRTDAFRVYHEMVKYIDEQIAKIVFGQDVVSNNTGKVVGTVGENIANMYGDSDAVFIERLVNGPLFDMMKRNGVNLTGLRWKWDTTEKVSLEKRSEIDLRVSQMGFRLDAEYIEQTYGTKISEDTESNNFQQELKNMYRV